MIRSDALRRRLQARAGAEVIDHADLRARSGLPGPRANLELVQHVADTGTADDLRALLATGDEFLVMCGTVGYGSLLAAGDRFVLPDLRRLASDERWRVREAVAMALQRWGDVDFDALADEADRWADGTPLEQRAAAAALCEPRLLSAPERAARVLVLLECVTQEARDRTLRKALGYCWSVAVAADPERGLRLFGRLRASDDPDVVWIVRESLKKKRLQKLVTGPTP